MPNFFKQSDFDLIQDYSGKSYEKSKHNELKVIYNKLEHLCQLIVPNGFEYTIRKDPRKQAGPGTFEFRNYQWARIYPKEYYDSCFDKFCYIIGVADDLHFHMMGYKEYQDKAPSKDASGKSWHVIDIADSDYGKVVQEFLEFDKLNRKLFIQAGAALGIQQLINELKNMENLEIIELLKSKKQIILQGPPGTGKTRKAKEIAKQLTAPAEISEADIRSLVRAGIQISSTTAYTTYQVLEVGKVNVAMQLKDSDSQYKPSFAEIINAYKIRMWEGKQKGGNDPYAAAIAKFIFENIKVDKQFKLIQFHPSYSYEDFVRGIVAKANGKEITYETENKILAEFAEEALENWKAANDPAQSGQQSMVKKAIGDFKEFLSSKLEEDERLMVTKKVFINRITDKSIRYNSDAWEIDGGVPDSDIEKMYLANVSTRQQVKELSSLSKTAKSLATYWLKVLELFKKYVAENGLEKKEVSAKIEEKNYVLIIDEINRANLPAVLGELIYALEYRGEEVNSMYELDGAGNKLILPPNLYIIGSMNTADRSVGHIDYAIRRRFAFVDSLPDLEPVHPLMQDIFKKVSELFIESYDNYVVSKLVISAKETLSGDFRPEDVWLGHSYFICKKDGSNENLENEKARATLSNKLKYEVLPILREYIKDGILQDNDKTQQVLQQLAQWK